MKILSINDYMLIGHNPFHLKVRDAIPDYEELVYQL
jgi:hypothetical protein